MKPSKPELKRSFEIKSPKTILSLFISLFIFKLRINKPKLTKKSFIIVKTKIESILEFNRNFIYK